MTGKQFLTVLALLAVPLSLGCDPAERRVDDAGASGAAAGLLPVQRDLNVIVVSFDALRADALGVYGNPRDATPHMDAFANDSFVFANAYSVAPVTPTSFAAAWSGLLPSRVFHGWQLRAPFTLASRLAEARYRTQAFINNVQLTPERGFDLGFDGYDWHRNDPDEQVLDKVKAWLDEREVRPIFLWVHFLVPHAPYRAHPEAAHLYRATETGRFSQTTGHSFEASSPAEVARIRDLYLGEVWRADQIFGALIDHLRTLSLLESSIVVLTSDHGEEFSEHGGFQHGKLYEEHLRVPLIIRHPEGTGRSVEQRVRNIDLLPTLLRSVGHPVSEALDGRVIAASSSGDPPPLIAISMTGNEQRWVSLTAGFRKLIVSCGLEKGVEMYDLVSDPVEQRDLAHADPGGVRESLATLRTVLGGDPCTVIDQAARGKAPTVGLDAESIEALRALGYLG